MREERGRDDAGSQGSSAPGDLPGQVPKGVLRDLQLVERNILREFVRLCDAHGLRYYLAYGTLLGAVRHRGFIPWDDDIDVTMPRGDYNRFAEVCASELRPGFRFQSYSTDGHYPFLIGKLLRDGTVLRHATSEQVPFQHSVYIDIFPLDGSSDSPWAAFAQRLIVGICRTRLSVGVRRRPLKRLLVQSTRAIPRRVAIAAFEAVTRSAPADRSARWICFGIGYGGSYRRSFPRNWFGSGAAQVFENLTFVGPVEWDKYLAQLYGDYMTPPPELDRVNHHEVTEVQLDNLVPEDTGASARDASMYGPTKTWRPSDSRK